MIPASALALLVAERIGAGERCPPATAEAIRRALIEAEACDLGCDCEARMERRRVDVAVAAADGSASVTPPPQVRSTAPTPAR